MVVDEDSSDFSLSHLSLLPFLCFHLHCHSLNCPALRSCDALTTRLPLHLVNPSCPLGFSMKPSLVLTGRHCPCSHASDINHSCLLRGTGFELEPTVWKAPSHRRQNVGEKFTWKADWEWSLVPTGYLLNERLFLLTLTGKILRSVGFSGYYLHLCCLC